MTCNRKWKNSSQELLAFYGNNCRKGIQVVTSWRHGENAKECAKQSSRIRVATAENIKYQLNLMAFCYFCYCIFLFIYIFIIFKYNRKEWKKLGVAWQVLYVRNQLKQRLMTNLIKEKKMHRLFLSEHHCKPRSNITSACKAVRRGERAAQWWKWQGIN